MNLHALSRPPPTNTSFQSNSCKKFPQPKHKRQKTETNSVNHIESLGISSSQKQTYQFQKDMFIKLSNMVQEFNLHRDTLYLAFQIYCRSLNQPKLISIPQGNLQIISLFLAIKYQEIYPPPLKHLFQPLNQYLDSTVYLKQEALVLKHLRYNLNLNLLSRNLDQVLADTTIKNEFMAQYLLQLAITNIHIYKVYQPELILQAITLIAKRKFNTLIAPNILHISKLLISAKNNAENTHPTIYDKYQQNKYYNVATSPL